MVTTMAATAKATRHASDFSKSLCWGGSSAGVARSHARRAFPAESGRDSMRSPKEGAHRLAQLPSKDIRMRNSVSIPYADIFENLECGLPPADIFRLSLSEAGRCQLG